MKTALTVLGALLIAAMLCVAGLIGVIEFIKHRSQNQVVAIVAKLSPGAPFSTAQELLGKPVRTSTNYEENVLLIEKRKPTKSGNIPTNSVLHTFVHHGPPFREILVFTDSASEKVLYADWYQM